MMRRPHRVPGLQHGQARGVDVIHLLVPREQLGGRHTVHFGEGPLAQACQLPHSFIAIAISVPAGSDK